MTKQTGALKLALEALYRTESKLGGIAWEREAEAIIAIHEALALVNKVDQEQPALVQGWKLVPVEPTEDMWKAVNKLDDEMAAGSYDGKGCSIEQAWNCLLAAAPQPAQRQSLRDVKPLTDEEIDALELPPSGTATVRDLVRLIEAAHGITKE